MNRNKVICGLLIFAFVMMFMPIGSQFAYANTVGVPTNISVEAGAYTNITYYFTGTNCQNIEFRKLTDTDDSCLIMRARCFGSGSNYAYYSVEYFGLTPGSNIAIQPYDTVTDTAWDIYVVSITSPEIALESCNGNQMEFTFYSFSMDSINIGYSDTTQTIYHGNGLSYTVQSIGGWTDQNDPTNLDSVIWRYQYDCKLTLYTSGVFRGLIYTDTGDATNNIVQKCWLDFNIYDHVSQTPIVENYVEAKCETEGGYDSVCYCVNCGQWISSTRIAIPAIGHQWGEPTYGWAEGYTTVTAVRVCLHDAAHWEAEVVSVTSEITKPATCEEMGETTYSSACFANEAFVQQTMTLADVEPYHEWSAPIYEWSEDNSTVTALHVCARVDTHVESEIVGVTSKESKSATCEEMGETTYTSGEFTNKDFLVQTKTLKNIDALGHQWCEAAYVWSEDNSAVEATRLCVRDKDHKDVTKVKTVLNLAKAPTDSDMGQTEYVALFEDTSLLTQSKTVEDIPALRDLKMLYLPSMLSAIEDEAFADAAYEGVIIPEGCTFVGSKAFAECGNLIYVRIPASVINIAGDAFEGSDLVRIHIVE